MLIADCCFFIDSGCRKVENPSQPLSLTFGDLKRLLPIIFIHQGAGVSFASIREEPGLFEVLDRILDSGIVIEISERTAPEGIELIHSQSRITVASQETYGKKL